MGGLGGMRLVTGGGDLEERGYIVTGGGTWRNKASYWWGALLKMGDLEERG